MAVPRYAVMLLPLVSAACAPIPHVVTLTPDITGTLTLDGLPMAGQEMRLARGPDADPCSIAIASTRTGPDGSFKLERQTQFRFLYAPLVAPLSVSPFSVCAMTPDKALLLHSSVVQLYGAQALKLSCTLKELQHQRQPPRESPPCQARWLRRD